MIYYIWYVDARQKLPHTIFGEEEPPASGVQPNSHRESS